MSRWVLAFMALWSSLLTNSWSASTRKLEKLNVLVVLIDDLNDIVYDETNQAADFANFKQLQQDSVRFENAYADIALCGPSRLSLLTGRLPNSLGYYVNHENDSRERGRLLDSVSFPEWFRQNGYDVVAFNKIFHADISAEHAFGSSRYTQFPVHLDKSCTSKKAVMCDVERKRDTVDFAAMESVLNQLDKFSRKEDTPWCLFMGIRRPHLRFRVPQNLLDKVEPGLMDPVNFSIPDGKPWQARRPLPNTMNEAEELIDLGYEQNTHHLTGDAAMLVRHGYYGAVLLTDFVLGQVMAKMKELEFDKNTVIVVTSDHGWTLGEAGQFAKGSVHQKALRVPMYIHDPWSESRDGEKVHDVVSLVDVFPTIADLAGIPVPTGEDLIDGTSRAHLVRTVPVNRFEGENDDLLQELTQKYAKLLFSTIVLQHDYWKLFDQQQGEPFVGTPPGYNSSLRDEFSNRTSDIAGLRPNIHIGGYSWSYPVNSSFSVWPVCTDGEKMTETCDGETQDNGLFAFMGFSVRAGVYRYSEHRPWLTGDNMANFSSVPTQELYDVSIPGGNEERDNLIAQADPQLVATFAQMIRSRFVPCVQEMDETTCAAQGLHCSFMNGGCFLRNYCGFSDQTGCDYNAEYCRWSTEETKCVETSKLDFATSSPTTFAPTFIPTITPTVASPTTKPTKQPTVVHFTNVPTHHGSMIVPTHQGSSNVPTSAPTDYVWYLITPRPTSNGDPQRTIAISSSPHRNSVCILALLSLVLMYFST